MNLETDSKLFLTEEETRDFLAAETAKAKRRRYAREKAIRADATEKARRLYA